MLDIITSLSSYLIFKSLSFQKRKPQNQKQKKKKKSKRVIFQAVMMLTISKKVCYVKNFKTQK